MFKKSFKFNYFILFLVSLLGVIIFHYGLITKEVNDHLPKNWGDPISISEGDISKDFSIISVGDNYIIAHVDGTDIKLMDVDKLGEVKSESLINTNSKFLSELDIFTNGDKIYLTYVENIKGIRSLFICEYDKDLKFISKEEIKEVKTTRKIEENIYAVASKDNIRIMDLISMEVLETIDYSETEEMAVTFLDDRHYIFYGKYSEEFVFEVNYMEYSNGEVLNNATIAEIDSSSVRVDNMRASSSNGQLKLIFTHIDQSFQKQGTSLGDFVYMVSKENMNLKEPIGIIDATASTGIYPESIDFISDNDNIDFIVISTKKLGTKTSSEDIYGYKIDENGQVYRSDFLGAFSHYYKCAKIVNDSLFYLDYNGYGEIDLIMTSSNEAFLEKSNESKDYERKIVLGLFFDRVSMGIIMMLLIFVVLGFIYGVTMIVHMVATDKNEKLNTSKFIFGISIGALLGKLVIIHYLFYGATKVFLPNFLSSFLVAVLINVIISLIMIWIDIYYFKFNKKEIEYPQMFGCYFLDGFISLLLMYPLIF